jgi:NADH-quinone oxidoreductase subunit E
VAGNGASTFAQIDNIIDRYGGERSALIQILLDMQKELRWLSRDALGRVSDRLGVSLPHVYQIATFYKAFSLTERGRHLVTVCLGTACHVRGAPTLLDRISRKLGIKAGGTTGDGRFTLLSVNCMGCCALGPVIAIDESYFSNPSNSDFDRILGQYK